MASGNLGTVQLRRLQSEPENGQMLHEWGLKDGNFGGVAVLHNIAVDDFADLALIDGKPNDQLLAALQERHQQGYEIALEPELPWLERLRRELMTRAAALSPPYSAFAEMRVGYWFDEHNKRIEAYRARLKPVQKRSRTKTGSAPRKPKATLKRLKSD